MSLRTTVVLHFGMHKTGSTSIQESLAALPSTDRFTYADLGAVNHSGALLKAFADNPEDKLRVMRRRGADADEATAQSLKRQQQLRSLIQTCESDLLILSGENIVRLSEEELTRMAQVLKEGGHKLRVVGYIRPPFGYMESAFQERLKGHTTQFKPDSLYPGYQRRFEKFERAFGRESVEYWLFDPASFPRHCAVTDFCTRLGIDITADQVVRANDGLSRPAASLLYAFRRFGEPDGDTQAEHRKSLALNECLKALTGDKLRLSSEIVRPILDKQRDDIAWMESRLGAPFAAPPEQAWPEAIRSEEDLWHFDPRALAWLLEQLGLDEQAGDDTTAYQVAQWMGQLRQQASRQRLREQREQRRPRLAPGQQEVVPLRRLLRDLAHNDMPEEDALVLVRSLFAQIVEEVGRTDEGRLRVAGLGQFRRLDGAETEATTPGFVFEAGRPKKQRKSAEAGD